MKSILALTFFLFLFGSCKKKDVVCNYPDSNVIAPDTEIQQIKDSLDTYNITATQHPTGLFYAIKNGGSGQGIANLCSMVEVTYKGKFFNGKVFDSTTANRTASFQLGEVIGGWQKGIPLIKEGGSIDLYIPPSLGYGSNPVPRTGPAIIPANSYLVFNVTVIDIQ
ncbi:hypothetical protein BH20BAC1_BH20BAC1_20060 [soil metagenome]